MAGPSLGGYIGATWDPRWSFLVSSGIGILAMGIGSTIKESIKVKQTEGSILKSVNPIRFTKLFSNLAMAKLCVTFSLMDAAQVGFFPLFLRFSRGKSRNCPFFRAFY